MYVYDLNCEWTSHSIALREFKVTTQEQIDEIERAGIKELYIDSSRGVDVDEPAPKHSSELPKPAKQYQTKPLLEERENAASVRNEAVKMMVSIMEDVRLGKPLHIDGVAAVVDDMADSIMSNRDASLGLICIKKMDQYTVEHSVNVSILLMAFEKSLVLDIDELRQLGMGGLLLDIGKAMVPLHLLNKPAHLTAKELVIAQKHVNYGLEILRDTPGISKVALQIVAEHHERVDGSGYPESIAGDGISIYGQMAAIADAYDALTANRVYQRSVPPHAALNKLMQAPKLFNQALVQQFIHGIGIYPIGSLVVLSNGCFAVVVESNKGKLLLPRICIIFDSIRRKYLQPKNVDLANQNDEDKATIISAVDPVKWGIKPDSYLTHIK
ncbi:hypothetical protein MNBD_GAMMA26-109 [hydrothermal vent metagenome]|uniref:HD-GYP domain-containing protein n=1 Tax=hydrothermal vent metagenome TaxID=652676 RepID=A0A3B1C0S5_9ZZZZ